MGKMGEVGKKKIATDEHRYLRHGGKVKDNEIGEIKGNSSLKKMGLLIERIYWI